MFLSQKDTHFLFLFLIFRRRRLLGQKRKRGGVSGGNVSHLHGLRRTWGKNNANKMDGLKNKTLNQLRLDAAGE